MSEKTQNLWQQYQSAMNASMSAIEMLKSVMEIAEHCIKAIDQDLTETPHAEPLVEATECAETNESMEKVQEDTKAPEKPSYTLEDIRAMAKEKMMKSTEGKETLKAFLTGAGVSSISALPTSYYDEFVAVMETI